MEVVMMFNPLATSLDVSETAMIFRYALYRQYLFLHNYCVLADKDIVWLGVHS